MRKYDVAYVPNGPSNYYPVKALEEMTYTEIVQKYIKTCGKANGNVSICSQCKSPCREGKRAIQLLANEVYNDPPIPLYGGKTLIEKAREENLKRREQKNDNLSSLAEALKKANEEQKTVKTERKKGRTEVPFDGWWEVSLESGDQIKWLMDEMKITKTQAKKKIYQYKYNHGLIKENKTETVKEIKPVEEVKVAEEVIPVETKPMDSNIESKLEKLLAKQEEHKKAMEHYMSLYNQEKERYEQIKMKTDILCGAMDILNE